MPIKSTIAERTEYARRVVSKELTIAQVAKETGFAVSTVQYWVKKYKETGSGGTMEAGTYGRVFVRRSKLLQGMSGTEIKRWAEKGLLSEQGKECCDDAE